MKRRNGRRYTGTSVPPTAGRPRLRGLACVLRDDSLVRGHDCSSGFPMPRMPAAVWTMEAANPVIARASDRFRLHYAGAERASQTDQQQNCYQPSKHASLSLQLRLRLYGPNRVGQVLLYMSNSSVCGTQPRRTVTFIPAPPIPAGPPLRGRTHSLSVGPVTNHAAATGFPQPAHRIGCTAPLTVHLAS